ncbi:MAG: hypothetical protein IJT94_15610 [Oscillibacter sp.]|nr:hypothetical protein [Oscillibacter sp.]
MHDVAMRGLRDAVGKMDEYTIRSELDSWKTAGVITDADVAEIEGLLAQNRANAKQQIIDCIGKFSDCTIARMVLSYKTAGILTEADAQEIYAAMVQAGGEEQNHE